LPENQFWRKDTTKPSLHSPQKEKTPLLKCTEQRTRLSKISQKQRRNATFAAKVRNTLHSTDKNFLSFGRSGESAAANFLAASTAFCR